MSARTFSLEIDLEFDQALEQTRLAVIEIAQRALLGVVTKTPVDTGQAKSNWFVTIGSVGFEISTQIDRTGQVSISRGNEVIATYLAREDFPIISIHNSLPYINRLENGYSNQAPAGMVAVTIAEIQATNP